ncbi:MAG: lipopolysaccharide biosynthesis protein, partial [Actinomycetota bacterium]
SSPSRSSSYRLTRLRSRLSAIGPEGLAARAGWAGVVEVLQLVSSVLVFVVLAKFLSTDDYGRMAAVLGIAAAATNLGGFGSHVLLIKRVSQGMALEEAWKRATSVSTLGLAATSLLVIGLQPVILSRVPLSVTALFVVSQVNFFFLTELAVYVGNGTRRLREAAQIRALVIGCRLAALVWFTLFGDGDLRNWATASFVSFGVAVILALGYVWRVFGAAPGIGRGSMDDVRQGIPFAANGSSESLVDVSDRPLLVRYDHVADAGIYGLGGRIVQFGYLPLRIVMRASDADLFEAGKDGVAAALRVTRSLMPTMVAIGAVVGVGLVITAPILPVIAGDKWDEAVNAIRLLGALPIIRGVQYLIGNTLSASDHQWWRVGATLSAAAVNFTLNLLLLPQGTWRTAVFTTMVSEVYLTGALALVTYGLVRREARGAPPPTPITT